MQANINIVYDLAIQKSMINNQNKINVVPYTRNKSFVCFNNYQYNHVLLRVNYIKDLGVFFDHELTIDNHVSKFKKKHLILDCMVILFKTFVRPKLGYNSTVWNDSSLTKINTIEIVQRKFII